MSIKRENEIIIDDGPESGQCSDDETEKFTLQRKSKKHKKRSKGNKSRKRKYSDSTSSSTKTEIEFFNPYSVNTDKFNYKSECYDNFAILELRNENSRNFSNQLQDDIIDESFNRLDQQDMNRVDDRPPKFKDIPISAYESPSNQNVTKKINDSDLKNSRKALYLIDKTGIESTHADLRYYLVDFGFSNSLASDVCAVIYNTGSPEREKISTNEDEEIEDNEDEMFNDLPIIDASANSHDAIYTNSYSPEPANKIIEPYDTEQGLPISYASNFSSESCPLLKPLNEVIDLQTIPDVGPRDPRLNHNKQILKLNAVSKFSVPETNNEKLNAKPHDNNSQINKEWEITVANMVKTHLRLYLVHNDINKEEYKSILKRAVNKIISSGEKKLETDKISKFLHSYVIMMQKSRYVDSI